MWAPLIEKAYAKAYGGYYNVGAGGYGHHAMFDLTGAPSELININSILDLKTKKLEYNDELDELFERIYSYDLRKYIMTCGTRSFNNEEIIAYNERLEEFNQEYEAKMGEFQRLKVKMEQLKKINQTRNLNKDEKAFLHQYNIEVQKINQYQREMSGKVEKDFGNGIFETHGYIQFNSQVHFDRRDPIEQRRQSAQVTEPLGQRGVQW